MDIAVPDPQGNQGPITFLLCTFLIARDGQFGIGFQKRFPQTLSYSYLLMMMKMKGHPYKFGTQNLSNILGLD